MSALSQSLPNSFLAPSRALRHLRHYPTLLRPYHPPSPKPQQRRLFSLRHSIRARYASLPYTIRLPISTFLTLITWFPVLWFLHNKVFQLMLVNGPSMYPFLNTDHYTSKRRDIVAVKMWKAGYDVRRGDVVVFRSPLDPEKVVLKRVIAVEGDVVQTRVPYPVDKQEIAIGHVWVEGEHPEHSRWSYDSNSYGAVRTPSTALWNLHLGARTVLAQSPGLDQYGS
ncbi:MAG: hypothetical protein LQ352_006511 [Teloschistes flavicans]|nr:MAG: hypothetical protein LQ352_006511 [Teloschistes flavicans]